MKDDWTKDIRDLMADHEGKAPDGLLDDIKTEMGRRGLSCPQPRVPQRARVVSLRHYRWAVPAAVAIALAIMVAVPMAWKNNGGDSDAVAGVGFDEMSSGSPKMPISSVAEENFVASVGNVSRERLPLRGEGVLRGEGMIRSEDNSVDVSVGSEEKMIIRESRGVVSDLGEVPEGVPAAEGQSVRTKEAESRRRVVNKESARRYDEVMRRYDEAVSGRKKRSGMTLTAFYGGAAGGSGGGKSMPVILSDALPYGMYSADMMSAKCNVLYGVERESMKAHHDQPIKVGVNVGYRLNHNWSVRAGVTYSYLSSDFTSEGMPTRSQKLHYVGVPLSASYAVLRSRKAEVYVMAGGEVEKLVKGNVDSDDGESRKVKENRPQLSVKAAVGGAYNITPSVSVYAEPGVSYYFDNNSPVINVYKDCPTSFSLNLGLRININND